MSLEGAPPSVAMAGAWTGSELAVIDPDPRNGLTPSLNAYDPVLDSWRNIPVPSNVAFRPRTAPYVGAVSGKLIVYGGRADPVSGASNTLLTDGWVIDLTDSTWTPMTAGPPLWPWGDGYQRVFADGPRALFVPVQGYIGVTDVAVATYDLSAQTWETAPIPPLTNGFGCDAPGWNGHLAVCASVFYLFSITSSPLTVTPFPSLDETLPTGSIGAVFAPSGDRFFGLGSSGTPGAQDVFWVDPAQHTWSTSTEVPALGSMVATANGQLLVWGQGGLTTTSAGAPTASLDAEVFDPVAGAWSPVTCAGAPTWPIIGMSVATPAGLIVFDGAGSPSASGVLEL